MWLNQSLKGLANLDETAAVTRAVSRAVSPGSIAVGTVTPTIANPPLAVATRGV